MRFGTSEGMMLAAGPGGSDIFVLIPRFGRGTRHAGQVTHEPGRGIHGR